MLKKGITDYNLFNSGYESSMLALDYLKMDRKTWDNLKIKSLKDLNISGLDLTFINKNNRSKCLNYLAKEVLENVIDNKYNILLKEAKKWNISQ